MQLIKPSVESLAGYKDALERGWSPDTIDDAAGAKELRRIEEDPRAFVASLDDREAKGPPIELADGSLAQRLPGYHRWLWDAGAFVGNFSFRWKPGTTALPPGCPGHIGYSIVPWKRRHGYATAGLRLLLQEIRSEGLPFVDLVTERSNVASQRVIAANGGVFAGRYVDELGGLHAGSELVLYRIPLDGQPAGITSR